VGSNREVSEKLDEKGAIFLSDDIEVFVTIKELVMMFDYIDDAYQANALKNQVEAEFVDSLYQHLQRYGNAFRISSKQLEWLRRIYEKAQEVY
jgi:hypothetical protein